MIYVKIGGRMLQARTSRRLRDARWDGRDSITITAALSYEEASSLFVDDVPWSIVGRGTNELATPPDWEQDQSEYCIAGPITDNRDGTMSCKMGKPTESELLAALLGREENG